MNTDPNVDRNDEMIAEYWRLGEALQDSIIASGYETETVEGIAVDIHDVIQAAERIRDEFAPAVLNATDRDAKTLAIKKLREEFAHIAWHCVAAQTYLSDAESAM